jgi:hypothetical protein
LISNNDDNDDAWDDEGEPRADTATHGDDTSTYGDGKEDAEEDGDGEDGDEEVGDREDVLTAASV